MHSSSAPDRKAPVQFTTVASSSIAPRLPSPLTSLVGREREIAEVAALLREPAIRLVTLTGPGGVGKTRLAIRVAFELEPEFPDGVVFVELASVREPELVFAAIAQTLEALGAGHELSETLLKNFIRRRRMLLILDNFEQVRDAGPMVTDLLQACPQLCTLVTSRSLLNVTGEQTFSVPQLSLNLGEPEHAPWANHPAQASDAARLFVERARAINPKVDLTPPNDVAISEIVRRLDGLPLAIELAAARCALFSPRALLDRLDQRLPLLEGGARDNPARHQTMRAAIAWSYDLLTPLEQKVFRDLGQFSGGFTLEAAEFVCAAAEDLPGINVAGSSGTSASRLAVIEAIESLTRQSLVRSSVGRAGGETDGTVRISMLETIREFALEQVAANDELAAARRHATYYLGLAVNAEPTYWGDAPGDLRNEIDLETGNLQASFEWSVAHNESDMALKQASARFDPHWTTGASAFAHRQWVRRALAMPGGAPLNRVKALTTGAWLAHIQDDFSEVRAFATEALSLARAHDDESGIANASFVLGVAHFHEGNVAVSRCHLSEALAGFRAANARGRSAWTLSYLASLDARFAIDEGGDPEALERATQTYEDALAIFNDSGHYHGVARALHGLAYVAYQQRDLLKALSLSRRVLELDWEQRWPIYYHLEDIADIAGRLRRPEIAARLYGAADNLRERAGRPVEPVFRDEYERDVEIARRALGPDAFAAAFAIGRALTPDQAVLEAQAFATEITSGPETGAVTSEPGQSGLTPRESDVLRLLARGQTDREIASELFISRRTVSKHVEAIFTKLGVHTRTAAGAEAVRRGLVTPLPDDSSR